MKTFEEFISGGRDVGKWEPRVFIGWCVFPVYEIFVALSEFARVDDRGNGWRFGVFERKRIGVSVSVEFGGIRIGFEKGNMEYGMESREI